MRPDEEIKRGAKVIIRGLGRTLIKIKEQIKIKESIKTKPNSEKIEYKRPGRGSGPLVWG